MNLKKWLTLGVGLALSVMIANCTSGGGGSSSPQPSLVTLHLGFSGSQAKSKSSNAHQKTIVPQNDEFFVGSASIVSGSNVFTFDQSGNAQVPPNIGSLIANGSAQLVLGSFTDLTGYTFAPDNTGACSFTAPGCLYDGLNPNSPAISLNVVLIQETFTGSSYSISLGVVNPDVSQGSGTVVSQVTTGLTLGLLNPSAVVVTSATLEDGNLVLTFGCQDGSDFATDSSGVNSDVCFDPQGNAYSVSQSGVTAYENPDPGQIALMQALQEPELVSSPTLYMSPISQLPQLSAVTDPNTGLSNADSVSLSYPQADFGGPGNTWIIRIDNQGTISSDGTGALSNPPLVYRYELFIF